MLKSFERVWSAGAAGQPDRRIRQITLTNQIGLSACMATLPYQLYYLIVDPLYYLPILLSNIFFMSCYLSVLPLNRAARFDLARNVVLAAVYVHLFVVSSLISSGAGVHFFYFPLAACLGLLLLGSGARTMFFLIALAAALCLICHFAFPPGSTPLTVEQPALNIMYAGSVTCCLFLSGIFSYLFRFEIDRAQLKLTRTNEELERLSGLDPLTGIANRRAMDARIASEWARARRHGQHIALLLCDVDCFKNYNDHYGHLAGDRCLQRVADVLSSVAQRTSDLVARYGGEEFVMVLPGTDCSGALRVAEEARALVSALGLPHEASTAAPVVTLSVGVVCALPDALENPEDLLRRADAALYAAKRDGRNRVVQGDTPGSPVLVSDRGPAPGF